MVDSKSTSFSFSARNENRQAETGRVGRCGSHPRIPEGPLCRMTALQGVGEGGQKRTRLGYWVIDLLWKWTDA